MRTRGSRERQIVLTLSACTAAMVVIASATAIMRARPTVVVPQLTGVTVQRATTLAREAGLQPAPSSLSCIRADVSDNRKEIINQRPLPGTVVPRGSRLQLQVGIVGPGSMTSCSPAFSRPSESLSEILSFLLLVTYFVLPFVAAADMRRRGERGWLWGLVVFAIPLVGIVAWLIMRRSLPILPHAGSDLSFLFDRDRLG